MSAEHKMAPHAGLVIGRETPDQPAIHRLLELSDAYAASLYPAESNHLVDVATLLQPNVIFLVARQAGAIIGCGSVVLHCEEPAGAYAEIKRMYVDEHARGLKLGRRLLEALEAESVAAGVFVTRLETGIYNHAAIALYERLGYRKIPPFAGYWDDPLSVFYEKRLAHA